jgi:hypothetical protein
MFSVSLPEDGGRTPKHVGVKTVYFDICFVCANIWFLIVIVTAHFDVLSDTKNLVKCMIQTLNYIYLFIYFYLFIYLAGCKTFSHLPAPI